MRPVLCFGEALVDCLQTDVVTVDGISLPQFTHYPGGAPANVAVAVAKLGGNSHFIGQVGNDQFGGFLKHALIRYGVETSQVLTHQTAQTPLAVVSLDDEGERSFSFYRSNTADLLFNEKDISWNYYPKPGILHICSNTLTDQKIYQTTLSILETAKYKGWQISFDINYRHSLWEKPSLAPQRILTIIEQSDIVKASQEEIDLLFKTTDIKALIQPWTKDRYIILTDGGNLVTGLVNDQHWEIKVPRAEVVDTTGAGDSFVGGLLYQLSLNKQWTSDIVQAAMAFAVQCGAITVTRKGAYPALPWNREINKIKPLQILQKPENLNKH